MNSPLSPLTADRSMHMLGPIVKVSVAREKHSVMFGNVRDMSLGSFPLPGSTWLKWGRRETKELQSNRRALQFRAQIIYYVQSVSAACDYTE
jgi:hypothetical protein